MEKVIQARVLILKDDGEAIKQKRLIFMPLTMIQFFIEPLGNMVFLILRLKLQKSAHEKTQMNVKNIGLNIIIRMRIMMIAKDII